jgi:uncharacterized membrane protein YhaH (DUF805 family)
MRGVISAIAPDGTYGQLSASDGQKYSYWTSEVRNGHAQIGQMVEFQIQDDQPIDIFILAPGGAPPPAPPRAGMAPRMGQGIQGMHQGGPQGMPMGGPQGMPGMQPGMQQGMHQGMPQGMPQQGGHFGMQGMSQGMPRGGYPAYPGAAQMGMPANQDSWISLFTSATGRISRRQFWLYGVLPLIAAVILLRIIAYVIGMFLLVIMPSAVLFVDLIVFLILLWPYYCISAKRFQDVGYPGWYNLFWIVPSFLGQLLTALDLFLLSFATVLYFVALGLALIAGVVALAALIFVFIRAGQQGPNQYGPDPLATAY